MNPLLDFQRDELGIIGMALQAVSDSTQMAIEHGVNPPDGLLEVLQATMEKFQAVIESRLALDEQFDSIAQSLNDVNEVASLIESNPDTPTTEYK